MSTAHGGPDATGSLALAVPVLAVVAGYLLAASRERAGGRGWSRWRTASFAAGAAAALAALTGPVARTGDFTGHVLQHLLVGMLAPLGLALGAPVTLLLRAAGTGPARRLVRLLHGRPVRLLAHPVPVLAANLGGLYLLYLTPAYRLAQAYPSVHALVHAHLFVGGYLFAWLIAGPDPGPRRLPVPVRLVLLGVAVAGHATLAQLMYAGLLLGPAVPADEVRAGAVLMYYGGDLAEILLALALLAMWRPGPRRRRHLAPAAADRRRPLVPAAAGRPGGRTDGGAPAAPGTGV
ncbi:cytochrome c oxidase assembly protein [Micromonospora sp. NPDC049559]|uniref:cytochrome c oxidase assembly protein n=1 Tax=Micromonospora sp. NPDC049559 TaxID=3155923 RepID=UPI003429D150